MNTLSKLSFLTLALTLGACNEKVSPELQGAASSTTTSGGGATIVPPSEYYFRVVNTADTMLNFKLHKTGQGNANTNCEINSSSPLTSNAYRTDPTTYDYTCYYEAEELSLSYNGFEFAIEASSNTCDYIGYSPFSYFDRQAGTSSQSLIQVTCPEEDGIPTQLQIDGILPADFAGVPCGSFRNTTVGPATSFTLENDNDICSFDYTDEGGPNCDTGVVSISGFNVSVVDPDGTGPAPSAPVALPFSKTVSCGGKVPNCIDGPIKEVPLLSSLYTSGMVVERTTSNAAFTKEYIFPDTFGVYASNRKWVNSRRDLAALEIEYGNSNRDGGASVLSGTYLSSFGDPLFKYAFDPDLIANYANNKRMDGTTLVTPAQQTFAATINGQYSARPFSAEPYLGLNGFKTSPFYTMYCLDNAFDVKARVRMVVRDWDRVLSSSPTDVSFERISDVDLLPPFARQDVPYTEEITGDADSWNDFNDIYDWDDLVDMERDDSGIPYDPSVTIFRPLPAGTFTEGFLNPYIFPMESTVE